MRFLVEHEHENGTQQVVYRFLQKLVHHGLVRLERNWAGMGGQRKPTLNLEEFT